MLLLAYPKAFEVQHNHGWLPLHYALSSEDSSDVTNWVLQAYPEATENNHGILPLHIALQYEASNYVIKVLFEVYQKAAEVQKDNGNFPLQIALYKKNERYC
jgi:hypothetical protein